MASTNRQGPSYSAAYHRVLRRHMAVGGLVFYHALDQGSADYAPILCPQAGCPSAPTQRPGERLIGVVLEVQLFADAARVGPYITLGAGGAYYRRAPTPGPRASAVLDAAVGFDLPVSIARIRFEARYQRLPGIGVQASDVGGATAGLVLPVCLTSACN